MDALPNLLQNLSNFSPTGLVALIALAAIAAVWMIADKAIDALGGRLPKRSRGK